MRTEKSRRLMELFLRNPTIREGMFDEGQHSFILNNETVDNHLVRMEQLIRAANQNERKEKLKKLGWI